jgi:crotonobetainyl-CoA:carnitine CoA-transferase CaiB-like acyl-CoA transferase
VPEFPVRLSRTPSYAGGPIDRGAPCYGEDNHDILSTLLGYSDAEIQALVEEGVL